jgi:hypothetical protein
MKTTKSTGKPFPKGESKIIPAGKKVADQSKVKRFMSVKERLDIHRRKVHLDNLDSEGIPFPKL